MRSYSPPTSSTMKSSPTPSASTPVRPFSPSSLRDIDIDDAHPSATRDARFPPPPTGHQLMALFPPPPPNVMHALQKSSSEIFRNEERAFFARSGKEVVRLKVELGPLPPSPGEIRTRKRARADSFPYPPPPPLHKHVHAHHQLHDPHPHLHPHPHPHHPRHPHPVSHTRARPSLPPQPVPIEIEVKSNSDSDGPVKDDIQLAHELDDESWKRPMPYNERRRAGKHTRRVVVKTQ